MDKKKVTLLIEIGLFIAALCIITFVYYFAGNDIQTEEEAKEVGIVKITDENFEEEIINSDKPVILEFSSNSCPPCITMVSTMINIAKENENIKVAIADESDIPLKTKEYNIEATPTIMIFNNGEIQKTFIGVTSEENLLKELK